MAIFFNSRFPRDKELKKRWLAAINKKFCGSLRICSRHFKEEDIRYSLIESKRYLKKGAIPSLYLNEKSKDDLFFHNQDLTTKENQLMDTVETTETKSSSIEEPGIKSETNDQLSHIIKRDEEASVEDKCTNVQFTSQECYSKSSVCEK